MRRIVFIFTLLCVLSVSVLNAQEETVPDFRVTSTLPQDGADDIAPDTVLTVFFNRPVVPLLSNEDQTELPNPLTIEPAVEGTGEWLNTSIYTFTPSPAWAGSTTYTVTIEDVTSVDNIQLSEPYTFTFTTMSPEVVESMPLDLTQGVPLTSSIQMTFNQPVDRESVEAALYLRPQETNAERPAGIFEWNDENTGFRFVPEERLALNTAYEFGFEDETVQDISGNAFIEGFRSTFATVPLPSITGTSPGDGETNVWPYAGITIYFASPMNPETLNDKVTISPNPAIPPEYFYREWSNSLEVQFSVEPSATYTINIAPGMEDVYGNAIETPFTVSYTTGPYDPELTLKVPGGTVGYFDAGREKTQMFLTHRNVSRVDLGLYNIQMFDFVNLLSAENYYSQLYEYNPRPESLIRSWQIPSVAPPNVLRYELLDLGATASEASAPPSCPEALPSRAKVGDMAQVITEPDPLRARANPPDGEIVDLLYKGYNFEIVGGPTCTTGIIWWQIRLRDNRTAWVAESVAGEYLFEVTTATQVTPEVNPEQFLTGGSLPKGVYFLSASAPELSNLGYTTQKQFLIVSTASLTMKTTIDSVVVWATDLRTGEPLSGVPVSLYRGGNSPVAQTTDEEGLARFEIERLSDLYVPITAVIDDGVNFGVAFSEWTSGIEAWNYNVPYNYYPQRYSVYMYTDRQIYRPGQPVYYRGIVREKDDVTYSRPEFDTVPVVITDYQGTQVFNGEVELSEYGTFSGQFDLAADAGVGGYFINVTLPSSGRYQNEGGGINFDVAEYRLPEFEVTVAPTVEEVVQNETITVAVNTRFFFGGPVRDAEVSYYVTRSRHFFEYEGQGRYTFFNINADDSETYMDFLRFGSFGSEVARGTGRTDRDGNLIIEVPADIGDESMSQLFNIEASILDETGQTVSGRAEVVVHQGEIYLGVGMEEYVGVAGEEATANIISVDWESNPVPNQEVQVEVYERRWSSVQTLDQDTARITYEYEVEEIPLTEGMVTTGDDGKATFNFTPPNGGIFKVLVRSRDAAGNEVVASTLQWVSDTDYVAWRQDNNNRIDMVADKENYNIGETAEILITSPFQGTTETLITIERGDILETERVTMESNSLVYEVPIEEDLAPTIYVSAFLVKGVDDTNPVAAFRMGIVDLQVETTRKQLNIEITTDEEMVGPRETVTYTIKTTDYAGNPVSAEVGVGLTDLASLSLGGNQFILPILEYFYGTQGLGVRTATPLTINVDYITQFTLDTVKGGGGGGGDGNGLMFIREEFLDTAYWNASLVTDETGTATFEVTLPDNLTTWRLQAYGLTSGEDGVMLVGQESMDILSTKPLLVRPVAPRFFIVGDEVELGAVVNNNSNEDLTVLVTLEANGVTLDGDAAQEVEIPANDSARVDWMATVDDVENVELIFTANGGGEFNDATRPAFGQGEDRLLPVYRYEAPDTVGTGGILNSDETDVTEEILLPEQFEVTQGNLTVKLEPSLAATTLEALDAFETYEGASIEGVVSSFLPNVYTYQALQDLGYEDAALEAELEREVNLALQRLYADQKPDGGWGWYIQDDSNALVTTYALMGLVAAREAGYTVSDSTIDRAVTFLSAQRVAVNASIPDWRLNRQAFMLAVMAYAGSPDVAAMSNLYESSERLDIYAKALLAWGLYNGGDETRANNLLDNILGDSITSANGTHWEEEDTDYFNWNTNTRTTAIVLDVLVEMRPDADIIPSVVRWLVTARAAEAWETTQETAWAVMALTEWFQATGELNADYSYSAVLNNETLTEGEANAETVLESETLRVEVAELLADEANQLTLNRSEGDGVLYYTAYLNVLLPVPEIEAQDNGIFIERYYTLPDSDEPITEARVGEVVQAHLTIVVPSDMHYVVVEDPLPAGAEGIDPNLRTSQQVGTQPGLDFDENDPLSYGWGWWWFSNIAFEDEKVVFNATYLPAGTYNYVYTMRPSVEGTFNVIPPTAREFYFPEVYGRGAGSTFTVLPAEE